MGEPLALLVRSRVLLRQTRVPYGDFVGGKMSIVDVELLVVPDCPNESGALSALRLAFEQVGLTAQSVRMTVIASQEQAQERGFVGSPTILIEGVDPFGIPGQSPAVACRVYVTPDGLSGVPQLGDVVSALAAARDRDRGSALPQPVSACGSTTPTTILPATSLPSAR